jgi:hypothetical protein
VATIDIELTNIDINQCDLDTGTFSALDVFRGTHQCPVTTKVRSPNYIYIVINIDTTIDNDIDLIIINYR